MKIRPPGSATHAREIREPEFAARLDQACDAHSMVPLKHSGRQAWIQRSLKAQYDEEVSPETVRKWFAGEAKPRPAKLTKLALLLEVDEAWLSMGVSGIEPRTRIARNATADGAVNLVAGLIQMDGGQPAFPDENDQDAKTRNIDLHAIIRGGKYDIHVTVGERVDAGLRFHIPYKTESVVVLGVIRDGFNFRIFDISSELIAASPRRGMTVEVTAREGDEGLRSIESFKQRL